MNPVTLAVYLRPPPRRKVWTETISVFTCKHTHQKTAREAFRSKWHVVLRPALMRLLTSAVHLRPPQAQAERVSAVSAA